MIRHEPDIMSFYNVQFLFPGVLKEGDIERTDGCQQAAALADKI